jgi:hypothetical protein
VLFRSAPSPGNVALEFGPEEGAAWTKTCERSLELSFEELSVVMGGEPVPAEYLPELSIEVSESERRVFTDRVIATKDGRHTRLERSFEEIEVDKTSTTELTMMGQEPETTVAEGRGTSPLEGETVVFSWNEDDEEYDVEWAEKDGAESALEGLVEDTDARALLPEDELEVGDSWSVAFEDVPLLFEVGGDLALELEGENVDEFVTEQDSEEHEGELELTLSQLRESDDGAQLAVVEITGELVHRATAATDLERIPVVDGDATQDTISTFDLSGELLWDLSEGRLHALALHREIEMVIVVRKNEGQEGPDFESTHVLRGNATLEVTSTPAE